MLHRFIGGRFSAEITSAKAAFQAYQGCNDNDLRSYWKEINKANPTRQVHIDQCLVAQTADATRAKGCGPAIERRLKKGVYNVTRVVSTTKVPTKVPTKTPTSAPA